jgi:hypothetical protein
VKNTRANFSPKVCVVTNLCFIVISACLKFEDMSFFYLNGLCPHKPWHTLLLSDEPPAKGFGIGLINVGCATRLGFRKLQTSINFYHKLRFAKLAIAIDSNCLEGIKKTLIPLNERFNV